VFLLSALVILNCQKADTEAPTVVATIPQDGATNVAINTNITIAFSELMDAASVSQAFSTNPTNTGEFAWNDTILTYNPGANLDTNRPYTVTITTDAKDLAGNSLTANYIFSFTTGSEASSHNIYMLGRSVLEGWFHHWGWDDNDDHPIDTLGFKLYHRYIVGPYEGAQVTVDTVRNRVENIPASSNPVIFFKLCFDDFTGRSRCKPSPKQGHS
jgi:hypothetical protein